jgi:molybdopterin-biosynthesis enzyme MoeA-like protein
VPEGAQLWWDGDLYFPQVVIENIVVFPGVPGLVKLKFEAVCWRFMGEPVATARLWTFAEEVEIATVLSEAQLRWPGVAIGSYPRYEESPHRVVVTLEGERKGEVEEVYGFLMERMVGASSA